MHLNFYFYRYIAAGSVLLLILGLNGCGEPSPERRIPPENVWRVVQKEAARHGLDAGFVYAIVWAESSLNAHARTDVARGLMQITEGAWKTVSNSSYRRAWNWRRNIAVGTAYLAYCRDRLNEARQFNYPLLAASYRFGPNAVKRSGYDLTKINRSRNNIYEEIFRGHINPVPPPAPEEPEQEEDSSKE